MNLYKISQSVNNRYDTYDSAIVAAFNPDEAKLIHPSTPTNIYPFQEHKYWDGRLWQTPGREEDFDYYRDWASPDNVTVELVGKALNGQVAGVILSSFNAG